MEDWTFHSSYCMEKTKWALPTSSSTHYPFFWYSLHKCTCVQYHHANSHVSLAGVCICRRAYWTVGTRYPCFLAMACAVQAISQSIAMPQLLPGFSVMCIKYKELRSCCTCCEREGCHILADENQRCY